MKARTILMLALALCFVGVGVCFAEDLNVGTWKLNETKSKIPPGVMKNMTVVYETAGDAMKVTTDGTDKDGKPMHTEWTGKFDGKDYPITGDPDNDTRAYKPVNDHTLALMEKKGGKTTITGRIVYSADGKTRTVTATTTNAKGTKTTTTTVYDKQ